MGKDGMTIDKKLGGINYSGIISCLTSGGQVDCST